MYNAQSYFCPKNLGEKVCIICDKYGTFMGIEIITFLNCSLSNLQIPGNINNISIFLSLEAALRGLLGALTSTPYSPTQHLEREQALAKQFAEILHFTLRFDELKVGFPAGLDCMKILSL